MNNKQPYYENDYRRGQGNYNNRNYYTGSRPPYPYDNYSRPPAPLPPKKPKKAVKIIKYISIALAVILLVGINIVTAFMWSILNKINYLPSNDEPDYSQVTVTPTEITTPVSTSDVSKTDITPTDVVPKTEEELFAESLGASLDENGLMYKDGVKNILLLGSDSLYRLKKKWNCNTDAIIIASIDSNKHKITLSSIMRDIYVYIPGRNKYDKINSACAYNGGPTRTVKVVEDNFGVKIDNFVIVSFYSFMEIVNGLGGVTVDINSGEKQWINNHILAYNNFHGYGSTNGMLYQTGKNIKLTGKQAMGYVRVRYSGNGDYERSERQREVLQQLIDKARNAPYTKLIKIIDKVASYVSTDFTSDELIAFAASAVNYLDYTMEEFRVPIDGTYEGHFVTKETWALEIDFEPNREALLKKIFGNE